MRRARSVSPLTANQLTAMALHGHQGRLLQILGPAGKAGVWKGVLAKQFRLSKEDLTDQLQSLVLRGLVRLQPGPMDVRVKITTVGRDILKFAERIPPSFAESLAKLHALTKLNSSFSAELASGSSGQIDEIIKSKMRKLLKLTGVGRVCWYAQRSDGYLERVYSVSKPDTTVSPFMIRASEIPYTFKRLMRGETLILRGLEDLPSPAERDSKFFRANQINSMVVIPSDTGSNGRGILGLASLSQKNWWTRDQLGQLAELSNLIVTAVERKIARHKLLESEQRFRCLFEEAPIGIALEGTDGGILFVNPAFCSMLGYTEDELRGKHCAQFSHPDDYKRELILFEQLRAGMREHYTLDKRFFRKDGSQVWGRINIALLRTITGNPPLVIGMVEDITEKITSAQELETAQEELQRLTHRLIEVQDNERRLISRELHDDIGQRLALLAVDLDVLRRSLATKGQHQQERRTSQLLTNTRELITDVQQLSHELHSSKLQHLGLHAALAELCRNVSKLHRVTLSLEGHPDRLPSEMELCFYRVAQEALNNIMKHSKAERVTVRLTNKSGVAQLEIKDTGVGFALSRSSTGIGLAGMRERLRMIGGNLTVISAPGKGTEIRAEVSLLPASISSTPAA
jgi:PAS domain S-box-containing protein